MFMLPVQNYYIRNKLSEHDFYKPLILEKISREQDPSLVEGEDNISKVDWENHSDFDRPWVKQLLPSLSNKLAEMAYFIGYGGIEMKAVWYQQYLKNSIHGWHVHSENYTGVYYLEFPKGSPKTELIDQYNINRKITINAKEGDVVIFPSFIIHRAPKVINDVKKTIISFNLQFNLINEKIFSIIDNL